MGHLSQYLEHHPAFKGLSGREVARRLDVGTNTAIGLMTGTRVTEDRTLIKIAAYLHPNAPEVRDRELDKLRDLVLLDTPFDLPDNALLLTIKQRALVRALINELLEASGKLLKVVSTEPQEQETADNVVVQMSRPERVRTAAYNPPDED